MTDLVDSGDGVTVEDINAQYHEISILWEIFLQTLVISLATSVANDIQQKYLDKLLSRWGYSMYEKIDNKYDELL